MGYTGHLISVVAKAKSKGQAELPQKTKGKLEDVVKEKPGKNNKVKKKITYSAFLLMGIYKLS